jgi:adenosylcobinamide kinase/adenosylcobinamide-phosphate guanylyltransferase
LPAPSEGPQLADFERWACKQVAALFAGCRSGPHLIVVSQEVGLGIVPAYPQGRAFRDLLGRVNQVAAQAAQRVYLTVAGVPLLLKEAAPSTSP